MAGNYLTTRCVRTIVAVVACAVAVGAAGGWGAREDAVKYFSSMDSNGDGAVQLYEMAALLGHADAHLPLGAGEEAFRALHDSFGVQCVEDVVGGDSSAEDVSPGGRLGERCSGWRVQDLAAGLERMFGSDNDTEPQQVHIAVHNTSAVTVMWVTKKKQSDAAVEWSVNEGPTATVSADVFTYHAGTLGWRGWIYSAVLAPVPRSASVSYRVGCNAGGWSETFSFAALPPSPNPNDAVFAVFGDMGTVMPMGWAVTEQITSDMASTPFDAVVHAGDVAYAGTGSTREFEGVWDMWGRQVQPIAATRFYHTAVGNHEKYFNFTSYLARLDMPTYHHNGELRNFYYSFDHGNVHFTMMSTEEYAVPYDKGTPQYAWLDQDLRTANENRAATPWIVLVGHRPMYSSDESSDSGQLQQVIEPLLQKYNVDICIWGHMHEYERSYPVYNNTAHIPSGNKNLYMDPSATTHLTIGTAGAMILERWVQPQPAWSAVRAEHYGYGQLHVVNATHLDFAFMAHHSGEVFDAFSIVRSSAPADARHQI